MGRSGCFKEAPEIQLDAEASMASAAGSGGISETPPRQSLAGDASLEAGCAQGVESSLRVEPLKLVGVAGRGCTQPLGLKRQ